MGHLITTLMTLPARPGRDLLADLRRADRALKTNEHLPRDAAAATGST